MNFGRAFGLVAVVVVAAAAAALIIPPVWNECREAGQSKLYCLTIVTR